MLKIAIVGNIAAGKSAVEKIISSMGYKVYDTDLIAHNILQSNLAVKDLFGTTDRNKIAKVVFSDKAMLNKLEEIIHPLVKAHLLELFKEDFKTIFVSVPQLFESGFDALFDKIIFISSKDEYRLARLMARNNLTKDEAIKRINAQEPEMSKISKADFIIENNDDFESLRINTQNVLHQLQL